MHKKNNSNAPAACHQKKSRGPTSFGLQDPQRVFGALGLQKGHRFLDLGCGPGDYALAAAEIVGPTGWVYALDIWKTMVARLDHEVRERGILNIRTMVADITAGLPLPDNAMDVCLIATVLHMPVVTPEIAAIGNRVRRVLKPGGRLGIIECSDKERSFGPPMDIRLSPERIERQLAEAGFRKTGLLDLGFNFMILFE